VTLSFSRKTVFDEITGGVEARVKTVGAWKANANKAA
jgi:hypothetical protein